MEEIFGKLVSIPGVMSITVVALNGELICRKAVDGQSPFDAGRLIPSIEEVGYLLDFLGDSGGPEVVLQGASVQAYLKRESGVLIILLIERTANLPTVYITLNSTLPKMRSMLSAGGAVGKQSSVEPMIAGGVNRNRSVMPPPLSSENKISKASVPSATAQRLKQLSLIGDWDAGKAPADAVGLQFVNHIYSACEVFMGDSTREILVREMKGLNVSPSTLSVRLVQDLIDRVVANLEDSRERKDLRAQILGDR
jgi:hypothetical protein